MFVELTVISQESGMFRLHLEVFGEVFVFFDVLLVFRILIV